MADLIVNVTDGSLSVELPGVEAFEALFSALSARLVVIEGRVRSDANGNEVFGGAEAGESFDGGEGNTAVGDRALQKTTTGDGNFGGGYGAGQENVTGSYSVFLGLGSGNAATASEDGVILGVEAGTDGQLGTGDVLIGRLAGNMFTGDDAVIIGNRAMLNIEAGDGVIAIGARAGGGNADPEDCINIGRDAGAATVSQVNLVTNSVAIGAESFTTRSNQVSLGNADVKELLVGTTVAYVAHGLQESSSSQFFGNAGNLNATNYASVAVGQDAMKASVTTTNAVAVGNLALTSNTGSNGATAIGSRAMRDSIDCIDTTMVGNRAGASMTTGVGATGIGFRVLEFATESRDDTAVGDSAFWLHQGAGGVAVGYRAAEFTTAGDSSVYVGRAAGVNRADGEHCVFVGAEAGSFPGATVDLEDGTGAVSAGDRVIGIGFMALCDTTGDEHVGIGHQAGLSLTGGSGSIFIGSGAGNNGSQKVDAENSIAIGYGAYTTADDQTVIGNDSTTHTALRGSVGIGLGLTAPSALLHVKATSGGETPLFTRNVEEDGMAAALRIRADRTTSGVPSNMGDNLGASLVVVARDDAGVDNGLANIGAIRKGADNTGEVHLRPFTAGVLAEGMVVRNRQAIIGWNTPMPAGGTAGVGLCMSTTANFGVFFGSGAPTLSAAKGSLYMRSDGSGTNDRMYVNTDGGTTWTHLVTGA